jgi:hypothetical protein
MLSRTTARPGAQGEPVQWVDTSSLSRHAVSPPSIVSRLASTDATQSVNADLEEVSLIYWNWAEASLTNLLDNALQGQRQEYL